MIVYDGIKSDFLKSCESDTIALEIQQNIIEKMGRHAPIAEFRSWENSLNYMYKVMNDQEIPNDVGVAIEFNIPQTAKRVDFMISGYNQKDEAGLVIVELKQWDKINKVEGTDALVETYVGGAMRKVVHPSYQAWSYGQLINDFNATVQDENIHINTCACLHNYIRKENDPLDDPIYDLYASGTPSYTKGQLPQLRTYIKSNIVKGDNKETIYRVDHGKIRPSKSLQNSISSMMRGNSEFVMIDEQKVAYEEILRLSTLCMHDYKKRTIICKGGPGTGKSVIAVNLLSKLTSNDQLVSYVSKNSAPRDVYLKKLKGEYKKSVVDQLFKGSGMFTNTDSNTFHTLLVDEAHRLNEKSGMFQNLGENQIKEIINTAYCSVFFIDESQKVTMNDIGSIEEIKKWANVLGSEVYEMDLISQFRCNGSNGYLAFVDDVLEIRQTANYTMDGLDYDIQVFDTPKEVYELIKEKNQSNNRSRMLAGYCWNWIKEGKNDSGVYDIVIDDFKMSWNLGNGEPFALSDTSIDQIGCIHTSQGLEFDYVGVIIGDDMRYEDGHIITDFTKRASTDQSLKGIKTLAKKDIFEANKRADEIIKNTYRTLMTRGMKGCYVYCVDEALKKYFIARLNRYIN